MPRKTKKKKEAKRKVIKISNKEYEILGENRVSARVFEAILARGSIIMDSLDKARIKGFEKKKTKHEKPVYKHTILLGKDDRGHNLRASIAVFENSVVVQTLREI